MMKRHSKIIHVGGVSDGHVSLHAAGLWRTWLLKDKKASTQSQAGTASVCVCVIVFFCSACTR